MSQFPIPEAEEEGRDLAEILVWLAMIVRNVNKTDNYIDNDSKSSK